MLNRWVTNVSSYSRWSVFIALLLSLILHLILFNYAKFDLFIFEPKQDVVEVRFASLVEISPPAPVEMADEAPEIKPELQPLMPEPELADLAPVEELQPNGPMVEFEPQMQTSPPELANESVEEYSEEILVEPENEPERVASNIADEQPRPLSFVETEFDIFRGIDGNKVGQTKMYFQSKEDGTYFLESESEARGIASLFISGKLIQRSEGMVTEYGLRPSSFLYQFGDRAGKTQRAIFDWESRKLKLETSKGLQTFPLPKDTQDLMSFMYQFMFVPPLQEMQLNITNGKRLKAYGYSFVGEEDLPTKMGMVRAMHLENINDDGDEKNEIWLAVDYRFLPVKIRKTEKDGSVIEQVMTNIKTDILQ